MRQEYPETAARLREAQEHLGKTDDEMKEIIGPTIAPWKRLKQTGRVSMMNLGRLVRATGWSMSYLLGETDEKNPAEEPVRMIMCKRDGSGCQSIVGEEGLEAAGLPPDVLAKMKRARLTAQIERWNKDIAEAQTAEERDRLTKEVLEMELELHEMAAANNPAAQLLKQAEEQYGNQP